jgi:crotonobetainyl-CoA:carnitine CoA-transferase CaiB-like acyl-CoA transferase
MPERISAWAVYDVFTVRDGQIFLAVVSDAQWVVFCDAFGFGDLKTAAHLATNNDRVIARPELLPELRARLKSCTVAELAAIFEREGLPFAPIVKPEALYDDPHLRATGGLVKVNLPDGKTPGATADVPLFPFTMDGERLGVRADPPARGAHTGELLADLGYDAAQIAALRERGAVA